METILGCFGMPEHRLMWEPEGQSESKLVFSAWPLRPEAREGERSSVDFSQLSSQVHIWDLLLLLNRVMDVTVGYASRVLPEKSLESMRFEITSDGHILTVTESASAEAEGSCPSFASEEELHTIGGAWPMKRLVETESGRDTSITPESAQSGAHCNRTYKLVQRRHD
jgi:hypothetical protein